MLDASTSESLAARLLCSVYCPKATLGCRWLCPAGSNDGITLVGDSDNNFNLPVKLSGLRVRADSEPVCSQTLPWPSSVWVWECITVITRHNNPLYTGRFLTSHIATSDICAHGFRCSYHNALMKHISNHNIQSEPALELLTCDRARARSA